MEASELKMRLDEALSVHRQAAARENEQQGYWQVCSGYLPKFSADTPCLSVTPALWGIPHT